MHKPKQMAQQEHLQMHNAEISKNLGAAWKHLLDAKKWPCMDEAKHLCPSHRRDHPGYKFQPVTGAAPPTPATG
ncbi:UNVERIFIED_CONTAM: hypothetical protein K2H54_001267 [Gekko kuhli]